VPCSRSNGASDERLNTSGCSARVRVGGEGVVDEHTRAFVAEVSLSGSASRRRVMLFEFVRAHATTSVFSETSRRVDSRGNGVVALRLARKASPLLDEVERLVHSVCELARMRVLDVRPERVERARSPCVVSS
jgi:hypothetical protein